VRQEILVSPTYWIVSSHGLAFNFEDFHLCISDSPFHTCELSVSEALAF
jgi:hypothetical protein